MNRGTGAGGKCARGAGGAMATGEARCTSMGSLVAQLEPNFLPCS